jgi:hypothetical protein
MWHDHKWRGGGGGLGEWGDFMKKRHAATSRKGERWSKSDGHYQDGFFLQLFLGARFFFWVDFYQNNKCVFDFYSHNFHKIFF